MRDTPRDDVERAGQVVLLVGARRRDLDLLALGCPLVPHLRQQVDIEFVGEDHGRLDAPFPEHFEGVADFGQALDALGAIVLGRHLCSLPGPANLVNPAADGLARDVNVALDLELCRECRAAPPRATPAVESWRLVEQSQQRPTHRRRKRAGAHGWPDDRVIASEVEAERACAVRGHDAIDTRARAEQKPRDFGWRLLCSAQQQDVQGEQVVVSSATQFGEHACLLGFGNLKYGRSGHSGVPPHVRSLALPHVPEGTHLCQHLVERFRTCRVSCPFGKDADELKI